MDCLSRVGKEPSELKRSLCCVPVHNFPPSKATRGDCLLLIVVDVDFVPPSLESNSPYKCVKPHISNLTVFNVFHVQYTIG